MLFDSDIKKTLKYLKLGVILSVVVLYSINMTSFSAQNSKKLSTRFALETDIPARFGWQIAAAKIVLETPRGMRVEGKSLKSESLRKGADFSRFNGTVMSVHNGYLSAMLRYGWLGVIVVIAVLWFLTKMSFWIVRNVSIDLDFGGYAIAVTFTLIALLLNALFHNACIFTYENISCLVVSLFLV